jgi:hypothetical protein
MLVELAADVGPELRKAVAQTGFDSMTFGRC